MSRQRKEPGLDHPISVTPFRGHVTVIWNGVAIADSRRALQLVEATYPPVFYIPREDVRADVLRPSDTQTYCPYKGDASYHSLESEGLRVQDAVWVYEEPHMAVAAIGRYLAFYPGRVERISVEPEA